MVNADEVIIRAVGFGPWRCLRYLTTMRLPGLRWVEHGVKWDRGMSILHRRRPGTSLHKTKLLSSHWISFPFFEFS